MTCAEAQELIEAVAGGDVEPSPAFAAHVDGCRDCAAALAAAVRLERALAGQPAPAAPVHFSQTVLAAIRRQRWQYEEHVDRAFNVTIAIGIALVVVAVLSLVNASALAQMVLLGIDAIAEIPAESPWPAAGSLPTVGLTAAVLVMALGIWWWAERRSDFQDG